MKKTRKNATHEKGITLISLVITIIIMIILATVAINLAVDSNGLFRRAGDTANIWNNSVAQEGTTIDNLMQLANTLGGTPPTTSTLPEGWNASAVADTVKEGDRIAPIPTGFVASQVEGEKTIADGLVIYEGTDPVAGEKDSDAHKTAMRTRNQYVWIPVDNINDMVMCSVCGGSIKNLVYDDTTKTLTCTSTHTDGTNPTLVGKLYATGTGNTFNAGLDTQKYTNDDDANFSSATVKLREPDDLIDTTYGDAGSTGRTAIKGILNTAATKYADIKEDWNDLLQDDFENMAKSVAKYGGFYISRYEIGAGGSSKKEQTVLNNSNSRNWWSLFSTLRSNPKVEAPVYSQMIWGSQYDQVMQFILEETRTDGTGLSYNVTIVSSTRHKSTGYEVSGNNNADLVCNIYDLEGNYWEWTSEASSASSRVRRGR